MNKRESEEFVGAYGASSRWALGSLVLVALAASEISGVGTIASLPVASITVTLSALCKLEIPESHKHCPKIRRERNWRDVFQFLDIWLEMLTHLCAAATCARIASATMDYMSEGRTRIWLFGYESHSLGEPWPDVLGVTIIVVITAMFMLGLENSSYFFVLLNVGIVSSLIFFVALGSLHSDVEFWTKDQFMPSGWQGMLTTAALCSFGFIDVIPAPKSRHRWLKTFGLITVPLLSYGCLSAAFTLMTHFRELSGTAIPMVRVFEARDVDWARPVIASCTIAVVSLALTEICPKLYRLIVTLAEHEWRILAKSLAYENQTTGSAVLAIFTAGSLSAILAFACPLSYLVRMLNVSPLLSHMLHAASIIYARYQPENGTPDFPAYTNVGYNRLQQESKSKVKNNGEDSAIRGLKFGFWFLPRTVRQTHSLLQESTAEGLSGQLEERECLLMGEYSPENCKSIDRLESNLDLEYDSDCHAESIKSSDAGDDENSTDIDAIVQEYKEKIKVATIRAGTSSATIRLPSYASGRRVLICATLLYLSSIVLGIGTLYQIQPIIWLTITVMVSLMLIIMFQPQIPVFHDTSRDSQPKFRVPLMPCIPAVTVGCNSVLAAMLMPEIWPGIVLWVMAGLILFFRCDCYCCDCDGSVAARKERIRLKVPPSSSIVSTLVPSQQSSPKHNVRRLTHVDTILISR